MGKMTSAVLLATYNGSHYIIEQLESLRVQVEQADRVLIIDDCSNDGTYDIIKKFIFVHKLNNWLLFKNVHNIGWKSTFYKGMQMCNEDIIFLCDQDDVWDPSKILIMKEIIESNSDVLLLASNYNPIYEDGTKHISKSIIEAFPNSMMLCNVRIKDSFLEVLRPGCTYALRKSFFSIIEKMWDERIAHDAILWRMAILLGGCFVICTPLIFWRRHSNSVYSQRFTFNYIDYLYGRNMQSAKENMIFLNNCLIFLENMRYKIQNHINMLQNLYQYESSLYYSYKRASINELYMLYLKCKHFYGFDNFCKHCLIIFAECLIRKLHM